MLHPFRGFPGGSVVKNSQASSGDAGLIPGSGRSPGGGHGYLLQCSCWRIPWTEEAGGLLSTGSQRVRHDWSNWVSTERCSKNVFPFQIPTYNMYLFWEEMFSGSFLVPKNSSITWYLKPLCICNLFSGCALFQNGQDDHAYGIKLKYMQ